MDTEISPALRSVVTKLLAWYDREFDQDDNMAGDFKDFLESVIELKAAAPYPEGQLGADIAHVVKPAPSTTRVDHVEALERLRLLTRPEVVIRSSAEQLAGEDGPPQPRR